MLKTYSWCNRNTFAMQGKIVSVNWSEKPSQNVISLYVSWNSVEICDAVLGHYFPAYMKNKISVLIIIWFILNIFNPLHWYSLILILIIVRITTWPFCWHCVFMQLCRSIMNISRLFDLDDVTLIWHCQRNIQWEYLSHFCICR